MWGAICNSVVRAFAHGAIGRWIDSSWGRPIEILLVSARAQRLVQQRPWYVLFLSRYQNGHLPYVRRYITVTTKCVECVVK